MPCITLDVQLLVQTFLYVANIVIGLAVAVPLGITLGDFNGQCILYADIHWHSYIHVSYIPSSVVNCRFSIYVSVCLCVLYGIGMTFYHVYLLTRKDPMIGSKMWVFPFIVVNSVFAFVTFISSCIISVGFKTFCDGLLKGREKGHIMESCAYGERVKWNAYKGDYRTHNFYTYLTVTQIATWSTFLVWVLLIIQGIIRFVKNRRLASALDLGNFAASEPSA
ncbi:transmembrane protein 179B-like [Haliotis asinina]|uniref:transmembrane protein 179B-like n=1 Tax=Haliotis asinina TaxID=109174 RepID=UPI0035325910